VATVSAPASVRPPQLRQRRGVEWGLLFAAILALVLLFLHEGRKVQAQAELAAVQATLGALRSAALLQDLHARASAGRVGTVQQVLVTNPFELLRARPGNYLGVLEAPQMLTIRPGSWFFDPDCGCVGYTPSEPRWLDSPVSAVALRFKVRIGEGPLQLEALERYVWQGSPVN